MEVHFNNPELQAKVEQWVADTGRPAEELLEDAMAGYFEELAQVRATLDRRYDDIKSGRVKLIPGDEARASLLERIDSHRKA
ncbi:MAG: addiction module protein [Deltaproteobacteria bacterium]|nr:addiction module protein [Deltaproteobacteria bacterium]